MTSDQDPKAAPEHNDGAGDGPRGRSLEQVSHDLKRPNPEKRPPASDRSADEQRSAEVLDDPDNLAFQ